TEHEAKVLFADFSGWLEPVDVGRDRPVPVYGISAQSVVGDLLRRRIEFETLGRWPFAVKDALSHWLVVERLEGRSEDVLVARVGIDEDIIASGDHQRHRVSHNGRIHAMGAAVEQLAKGFLETLESTRARAGAQVRRQLHAARLARNDAIYV